MVTAVASIADCANASTIISSVPLPVRIIPIFDPIPRFSHCLLTFFPISFISIVGVITALILRILSTTFLPSGPTKSEICAPNFIPMLWSPNFLPTSKAIALASSAVIDPVTIPLVS